MKAAAFSAGLGLALLGAPLHASLSLPASDAFGYTAAAQAYSWTEISGTGTPVTAWSPNADDGSVLIDLPFNFRFYGAPYNKVAISSNGYLQFGDQSSYFGVNCLGANQDPRNIAALYWMDLDPGAGGALYWQVLGSPGSRVAVIQFQAVPPRLGTGALTAQVRLYEATHALEMAWANASAGGNGAEAVSGLRSAFDCPNRTSLPLSCQQAVLSDSLAVRFSYPLVEPACGTPTISPTFSVSPTFTASPSITETFTASPTYSASPTLSATPSISPSPSDSPTASPSHTASPTAADTATASPTSSASPSPSVTRTPIVLTDAFGYVAVQAPLSWEDISATGQPVTAWAGGADDGSTLIDLPPGWLFRFYGADFSKVAVSSNGYLQFGTSSSAFGHNCLSSPSSPTGIAALYWMDLDLGSGGDVRWQVLGSPGSRRLIVQFTAVPDQGATGTLTAQAVLYEGSHALSFRYLSSASLGGGAAAAAGLRSLFDCPNRTGLSLSCNAPGLSDGQQFDISYPALEPACGTPTVTLSPSSTPSLTLSPSATPSFSASPTITETATQSPSFTVSPTFTDSPTITETHTISPTFSVSPTITETYSVSPTFSVSPTITETATESPSFTVSPTVTETATESPSFTISPTFSDSPTTSPSYTASPTATPTATVTDTPSATPTATPSATPSATPTATRTATRTASTTRTVTPTGTPTLYPPAPKPACLVLGQADYATSAPGSGSATGMSSPGGIALDTRLTPFKVYVADTANHRILMWNDATALSNGLPADGVIGQASFAGSSPNRGGSTQADSLNTPLGLAVDPFNGDLWVADSANHRVLRFSAPLALSGAAASQVLGQGGSFTSAVPGLGGISAASLNAPSALSFDGLGRLAVADSGHHRVLRFSSPASSASADVAWGQNFSLNSGAANQGAGVDAGGLNTPTGVHLGPTEVWIADTGNHRILRFSTAPVLTATANRVLGQPHFSSNSPNQGFTLPNETYLHTPLGLGMDGAGRLMVADSGNHRVLAYEPPFDNLAKQIWGQASFGSRIPATGQDNFNGPRALAAWSALLAVADTGNHRALFYGCSSGFQASTPTPTRSPTSTVTPTATISPTHTDSPTVSPSFTASESFTSTPTRTLTGTRTSTLTRSPTATITLTHTLTPTPSVTLTSSPAATQTVTLTAVPSQTPYPRSSGAIIAWPNPAPLSGGRACIGFPAASDVRVDVYDRLAQPVAGFNELNAAGGYACWDLRNREGTPVAPGMYFVRVLADGRVKLGRLTVR